MTPGSSRLEVARARCHAPVVSDETRQLVFLFHPPSGRRLRIEVPTVFGRSHELHVYREDQARFSGEDALRLKKLDWVEIKGDQSVSRTHGVIDPVGPCVRDLNSANGIRVDDLKVACAPGREGPSHPLRQGQVVTVGGMQFVVEVDRAGGESLNEWLALDRHAFLAPGDSTEMAALDAFLSERKRFRTRARPDYALIEQELEELAAAQSERLGIVVVALAGRPEGPWLRMGQQLIDVAGVIEALAALPGTKVLALQAEGDPAAWESAFRSHAYQDMVLVTSTVPSHSGVLEPVEDPMCTPMVQRLAAGVAGRGSGFGAYHAVLDGLDGLIRPDSNVLDQDWLEGYSGALKVVVGQRLHADPERVEVSYQPRSGPDDLTQGSFRVRHCFDSARDGSSRVPASALAASWRDDLRRDLPDGRRAGLIASPFLGAGLREFMHYLVAASQTGRLSVGGPELSGHAVVEGGRVKAASTSLGQRGEAALRALLGLERGKYEFVTALPPRFAAEVDLDLGAILAEVKAAAGA